MHWALTFLFCCVGIAFINGLCPHGWDEFAESCIYFGVRTRHTWRDSQAVCRAMNHSFLLSIDNEMKHNFILQIAEALANARINGFWIGGNDFTFEGQWHWLETGRNIGPYQNWGVGQPNGNSSQNCMMYNWNNNSLVWLDATCTQKHYFICERKTSSIGGIIG